MTARVGVQFDGTAVGALNAGKQTAAAIRGVRAEAGAASPHLRTLENDLGKTTRGALAGSGAFHSLGRSLAFASGGFLAAGGLAAALRAAGDELVAQVKIGAQVNAVLRSTGGVAGETAKSIDQLAKAEADKTGADSTQIKSAELMLLRFTNVRDVAGQGNDIFKLATQSAIDLAAALGGSVADQAATLGKALQDPYKGVTLLRRANVALTASEVENIKTLAQHGHALQAQKALLDAVNKSYGGTAKAVGDVTPWQKLGHTITAISASAIRPLLPEMDGVVERAQKWADGFEKDTTAQAHLKAEIDSGIATVKGFAKGANDVAGALGGWKRTAEVLLALKFASTMSSWAGALRVFIGSEAAAAGVAGAEAETAALNKRLILLRGISSLPFKIAISYEIYRKFIGPIVDSTSSADLIPVYRNGKWVNPVTGDPVQDQAYWNRQFQQNNPGSKPRSGTNANAGGGGASSTASGVVATAKRLGVGSGGVYGKTTVGQLTGGAIASNRVVDCSAYVQAVYEQNGFKGFPGTSETQWSQSSGPNWTSQRITSYSDVRPGDVVFMVGSGYPSPGHVGIVTSGSGFNARVMQYYSSGKPADTVALAEIGDLVGIKRFYGVKKESGKSGAAPPTDGSTASTNAIPARIRQAISAANVAVAAAALTPGKADDKAAIAESKAALESEIAWIRAKLRTNVGAEKKITLEDLLTGALGDLANLSPTGKKPAGATVGVITSLRNTVTNDLKGLPSTLDSVEQNAVAHLNALRKKLVVGLDAKDLAQTRAGIQNWGKVLKNEISAQAKIAADAATAAAALWQRGWQDDVNKVLRDFQENVVDKQLAAFDKETQQHLQQLQDKFGAQTPEEQALAAFDAAQAASDEAKQRASIASQIADTQTQLDALQGTDAGTTDGNGALIDIATGIRTTLQGNATAGVDIVQQRKDLLAQLADLQDQAHQLDLQDERAALQTSADQSRTAADKALSDAEASYQDQRDAQRQALSDQLSDQQQALAESLDDWNTNLEAKKTSWAAFIQWLKDNGYSTVGIANPNTGSTAGPITLPGGITVPQGVIGGGFGGAFAQGGQIGGRFIGRDSVPILAEPGEDVIDRSLNQQLRDFLNGRGGAQLVSIVAIDGREFARQTSQPMTSEQARQIGYTIQRG